MDFRCGWKGQGKERCGEWVAKEMETRFLLGQSRVKVKSNRFFLATFGEKNGLKIFWGKGFKRFKMWQINCLSKTHQATDF